MSKSPSGLYFRSRGGGENEEAYRIHGLQSTSKDTRKYSTHAKRERWANVGRKEIEFVTSRVSGILMRGNSSRR